VKYIRKDAEPHELRVWINGQIKAKLQYNYEIMPSSEKRLVKESLLHEQGYICCYTGIRISTEKSHIEHLKPRSESKKLGDHDDVSYQNMLAAFPGAFIDEEMTKPTNCPFGAQARKDRPLMVSPLHPNCESRFIFTVTGRVRPANPSDVSAEQTIEQLGLNHDDLIELRRGAINALRDSKISMGQVERIAQLCVVKNSRGEFREFCFVIKQLAPKILKQKKFSRRKK
jgi:uncharacterized protein (TIGR02646 family)